MLVVDDEESIRELVRDGLAVRGVHVDVAASGEEALLLTARRPPTTPCLCDLNLSGPVPAATLSGRRVVRADCRTERADADPAGAPQSRFSCL